MIGLIVGAIGTSWKLAFMVYAGAAMIIVGVLILAFAGSLHGSHTGAETFGGLLFALGSVQTQRIDPIRHIVIWIQKVHSKR